MKINNMTTKSNTNKEIDNNEADTQFLDELILEKEKDFQKQKEKVVLIEKNTTDKEIFDIQEFGKLYNLQGGLTQVKIDQKMIDDLEIEYYFKYPNVNSLKEFANIKTIIDREESN